MNSATLGGGDHYQLHSGHYEHVRQILHDLNNRPERGGDAPSVHHLAPGVGSATVHGGSDHRYGRGDDSINAGRGDETIIGGGARDTVIAGSGITHMVADGHNDSWGGRQTNVFEFDQSVGGGHHLIHNFTEGRDKLHLVGYETTAALQHSQVVGGSTVISLDGGKTEIVLNGVTNLGKHDFIK